MRGGISRHRTRAPACAWSQSRHAMLSWRGHGAGSLLLQLVPCRHAVAAAVAAVSAVAAVVAAVAALSEPPSTAAAVPAAVAAAALPLLPLALPASPPVAAPAAAAAAVDAASCCRCCSSVGTGGRALSTYSRPPCSAHSCPANSIGAHLQVRGETAGAWGNSSREISDPADRRVATTPAAAQED